ncbi:hypothetical protein D9M72_429450 [compost metagenome]
MRHAFQGLAPVGDHAAPARRGRWNADAEETQRTFRDDHHRHDGEGIGQQRSAHVRQNLVDHDLQIARTHGARGQHELAADQRQRIGAGDARKGGNRHHAERESHALHGRAEHHGEPEREHQARKGQHGVEQRENGRAQHAAIVGRQQTQGRAEDQADHRRHQAHGERYPRAVRETRQDVTAVEIRAQQVGSTRTLLGGGKVHVGGRGDREPVGRDGKREDEQQPCAWQPQAQHDAQANAPPPGVRLDRCTGRCWDRFSAHGVPPRVDRARRRPRRRSG